MLPHFCLPNLCTQQFCKGLQGSRQSGPKAVDRETPEIEMNHIDILRRKREKQSTQTLCLLWGSSSGPNLAETQK
jgi:hypothetical protein